MGIKMMQSLTIIQIAVTSRNPLIVPKIVSNIVSISITPTG